MNKLNKYFLYFLFGIIIYYLLNNKLVEGYNDLTLLFSVLKDRTDIGCSNYTCEKDEYFINPYSKWLSKYDIKDENFLLCNNSSNNEYSSLLNTGNCCNRDLCCE